MQILDKINKPSDSASTASNSSYSAANKRFLGTEGCGKIMFAARQLKDEKIEVDSPARLSNAVQRAHAHAHALRVGNRARLTLPSGPLSDTAPEAIEGRGSNILGA